MKTKHLMFLMAVMALASCVKEESVPQNVICDNSHERLTVYASTGNLSKTALDSEFNVLWSEGDKIKFVSADKSKEFTFTLSSGEGTTTGTFTLDEGQQVPADGSYIVYYPSTYDGSTYPVQKYLGDNVISGAPMKAEAKVKNGTVSDLSFRNVGGILRYTIKGEDTIASINIRSLEPETPLDVTLDCGDGVTINNTEGTVFNIAMKPGFYSDAVLYFMTTDNRQAHLSAELFRVYRDYLSLATISNLKFFPYHEFVDFDLPSGRLWATCNLGADNPEEIGYYFYWGNIAGHEFKNNQWVLAPGYDSEGEQWNPVNGNVPANATFDAARAAWDDLWRLPTDEEFRELVENTDNVWVENWNGSEMNGYLFTGRTDATRQIFLPAAGYSNSWECRENERQKYGTDGYYHTSDMRPVEVQIAPEIPPTTFYDYLGWTFNESRIARKEQDILHYDRYMSIRPVYDSRPFYTVKFDANGHGTNPASQVRFKGELVSEPQPLQADGYDFGGWFKERYCSTQWNFAEDKMKESITLYAKWTEIPKFTVTFSLNGHGTKAPEPLPKDDLLPGVFTFNNKRVQFSKGNLWCDTRSNPTTSNFHFEDEQYKSYPVTNDEVVSDTHVSHFSWFETMAEAVKHHAFNKDGYKQNYIFAAHNFTVGTSGGWQMMSLNDWVDEPGMGLNAFVYRKDSKGRPLMKTFPEICGVKCAVYLPDDWDLDRFPVKDSYDAATWAAAESRGAVCFPLAGCHGGGYKDYSLKELRDYNVDGHYWTTDIFDEPNVKQSAWAICLPTDYGFHQWAKFTYFDSYGCSIRLVKEKK